MSRGAVAAVVVSGLLLAGCVGPADVAAPECTGDGMRTAVLMAQSVPAATLVPCVEVTQPDGWSLHMADVSSDGSVLQFHTERGGSQGLLELTLRASCDVTGAVEVPSDEDHTRRFEDVTAVREGFSGTRTYLFDGGCVTYRFELPDEGWTTLVNDASVALTFVSRATLVEFVRDRSSGAVERL